MILYLSAAMSKCMALTLSVFVLACCSSNNVCVWIWYFVCVFCNVHVILLCLCNIILLLFVVVYVITYSVIVFLHFSVFCFLQELNLLIHPPLILVLM